MAGAPKPDPGAALDRFPFGPVWFSLATALLLAVLVLPWMWAHLNGLGWPPQGRAWRYLAVAGIGAAVGGAELVSRYRDEPWKVAFRPPGLVFVAVNAVAGTVALFLFEAYRTELGAPANGLTRVLLAGFGAMVLVRTKLLTLHQPGGTDVEVGPAHILDTLLAAVDRDVDRRRAEHRMDRVAKRARDLRDHDFAECAPHLRASLLAFQNMDADLRKMLNDLIQRMMDDASLKSLSNEVKFATVGYDYLTAFGERTFDCAFDNFMRSVTPRAKTPSAPG